MSEDMVTLDIDESKFEMKPSKRPPFVTVISILLFVFGIQYIVSLIFFRNFSIGAELIGYNPNILLINIIISCIWSIAAGIGMLLGKKWGWWLGVLFFLNQIARQVNSLFTMGSISGELGFFQNPIIQIILSLPTIIFLFQKLILKYFKLDKFPKWKSSLILISSSIIIFLVFTILSLLFRTGDAYVQLAEADFVKGNFGGAVKNFEKALSKGLNNYSEEEVHMALGNTYSSIGRIEDSISQYKTAAEINAENALTYANLCYLYRIIGDFESAEQSCYQALNIEPNQAFAHALLGIMYLDQGDLPTALRFLETSLSLDPKIAMTHANLALVYTIYGESEKADLALQQAEALGFENMPAIYQALEEIQNNQ
jgi:tetratricopeptide (TPR) repeat protein